MFLSFCKTRLYNGAAPTALATSRSLCFLQNRALIQLTIRFLSENASNNHSFTVTYLKNSCGLSPESAAAAAKKVSFETPDQPNSVISFLKNHGFSQTQITTFIKKYPKYLLCHTEETLLSKFNFFYSRGISRADLARILAQKPLILGRDLESQIIPSFNFLENLIRRSEFKVIYALKRYPAYLCANYESLATSNIELLRKSGVPESNIITHLVKQPRNFLSRHDRLKEALQKVTELGFDPSRQTFLLALASFLQLNKSTWERKFALYKEWGWSDEEIMSAFEKFPRVMWISESNISTKMDYFLNKMGLNVSDIASFPVSLGLSLEKRIIPRWSVYQFLLSEGLLKNGFSLNYILSSCEAKFIQRFVTDYVDEAPNLLKLYQEKIGLSK